VDSLTRGPRPSVSYDLPDPISTPASFARPRSPWCVIAVLRFDIGPCAASRLTAVAWCWVTPSCAASKCGLDPAFGRHYATTLFRPPKKGAGWGATVDPGRPRPVVRRLNDTEVWAYALRCGACFVFFFPLPRFGVGLPMRSPISRRLLRREARARAAQPTPSSMLRPMITSGTHCFRLTVRPPDSLLAYGGWTPTTSWWDGLLQYRWWQPS